ncbi:MAG TPA: hypothetical protein VMV45_17465 [Casimicrobiaceae bacterium]|nr:hypothetical protein [Casimicrobiaceae bacterium]
MMAFMVPFWWLFIASVLGFTLGFFVMAIFAMAGDRERDAEARETEIDRDRQQGQWRADRASARQQLSTAHFAPHAYASRGR